ncbi:PTS sugar transporter subunit IIB [Intestinimonas massiliensis (ex Afouda et al. 2020)]|uniref:PTS sugar transporter subunit IIB n=1 Tax=Intestinimonas massiliensis (ex Afouda et al. 2020) TaxID=1673721 RepID=UPI001031A9F4|nr:PTS sugar transporter subunit IIB [Intestinimonas massiliensis (ex Afouda et al. 2020)]
MADIKMVRVDARLVHGQVAGRWFKTLSCDRVVIVEDECAKDPFMVELFQLASPPGTDIICYSFDQALEEWNKDQFGTGRVIVLFKYLASASKAWHMGVKFKDLNVAQIPGGPGRRLAYATVSLGEPEIELLEDLVNNGVNVYIQQVPEDKQQPIMPVINKLRKK